MTARVLRPAITFTTVVAVLAAALAVYAFISAGSARADSVFAPTTTVRMCNQLPTTYSLDQPILNGGGLGCAETLTAGTATDFTVISDYPATNLNFSNVVTISPNAPTIVAGNPLAGGLRSATNLGVINSPCTTALIVDFYLYNVTLPNAATRAAMTNIAWTQPEGTSDRFAIWRVDDGTHTSSPPVPADPEWADPSDTPITAANGANADGTTLAIANYPSHLLDLFDPDFVVGVGDGALEPKIPLAAYGGLTKVAGTWVPLYFLVFPATGANSLSGGTPLPAPLGEISSSMGFPSVSVLTDPSAAIASPSTITDFCSALNVTTMLRSNVHSNPAAGTQMFLQYNASQRDTDQDGYENQIDTCPLNAAPAENPRNVLGVNDTDADGIMNSCDTNAPDAADEDVDNDGFSNRQDNCPQVANPLQTESEAGVAPADKGPRTDGIGDACDSEGGVITISQNKVDTSIDGDSSASTSITMSDSVANGRYMTKTNVVPKCFSGTDADGDGYCIAGGPTNDSATTDGGTGAACLTQDMTTWGVSPVETSTTVVGTTLTDTVGLGWIPGHWAGATITSGGSTGIVMPGNTATSLTVGSWTGGTPVVGTYTIDTPTVNSCPFRHGTWLGTAHPGLQMDTDGDTVSPLAGPVSNWSDAMESYLGTDGTKPCAQSPVGGASLNNEGPLDNWPIDFDDNGIVSGADIGKMNLVVRIDQGGNRAVNMGGNGDGGPTTVATISLPFMPTVQQTRFDLNHDGFLNAADVGKLGPYLSKACGVAGAPPTTLGGTFQQ